MRVLCFAFITVFLMDWSGGTGMAAPGAATARSSARFASFGTLDVARHTADRNEASTFKTVHTFTGTDGANPHASLLLANGALYGTTAYGGTGSCTGGCGTVFKITRDGAETVLHSFTNDPDGAVPLSSLIEADGSLFGTTSLGGTGYCPNSQNGCGTAYRISALGREVVLTSVSGLGGNPNSALAELNGAFYGTTPRGGDGDCAAGCGFVFKVTDFGTSKRRIAQDIIWNFADFEVDGNFPEAGLIAVDGALYGTTLIGGTAGTNGLGTVYQMAPSGLETDLYTFEGSPDGEGPAAALIYTGGSFYGTTSRGGAGLCYRGCGTVFEFSPSTGKERVLYRFKGRDDGAAPLASLVIVHGVLYGTTSLGGGNRAGTVFKLSPTGTETILHSFTGGRDGSTPLAGLVYADGALYGTTSAGGAGNDGTIFRVGL